MAARIATLDNGGAGRHFPSMTDRNYRLVSAFLYTIFRGSGLVRFILLFCCCFIWGHSEQIELDGDHMVPD